MSTTRDFPVRNHRPLASSQRVNNEVREVTKNGRDYLVFPLIALREMVIDYPENGTRELLHRDEIQESVDLWAGTPLTYIHPENDRKTADDPSAYTGEVIGQVFNPEIVDGEKLKVQAYLDIQKAEDLGGLAMDVVEQLRAGENLSVSAGYATFNDDFTDGEHDGEQYNLRQGSLLPDHVAIFPSDEFQARCDWEDGCGAPRVNAVDPDMDIDMSDVDVQDNATPHDFDEGDFVRWQSTPEKCGKVVHIDTERNVAMIEIYNSDMEPTGYTDTAAFADVVPMDDTTTNAEDRYTDPQDALERAAEIGCDGVHWHRDDTGDVYFMPCSSHDEYDAAVDANANTTNISVGEYVRLPNGSEPYGRVVDVVESGTRQCGSRVLHVNAEDADDIVMVAVDDFDRPVAHYTSSLEPWASDLEVDNVNGNTTTDTGAPKTNHREGQYVQWDWSGGTAYGQVIEKVTEPGTCRTVDGNQRCATEDRNVLVIGHLSEDGEDESQRVVKYEDNVTDWDAPSTADSVNHNYIENAVLNHELCPTPLPDSEVERLNRVTNAEVNGEEIDLTPPQEVQDVAQDFLDAHDEGLIGDSCGTNDTSSTGFERAEQLASGEELTVDDIMAAGDGMYGWFQRHGGQGNGEVDMREQPDDMSAREYRYQNCGYAAWRAWGGDPAWDWVTDVHDAIVEARENAVSEDPETLLRKLKTVLGLDTASAVDDGETQSTAGDDAGTPAEAESTSNITNENTMTEETNTPSEAESGSDDVTANATLEPEQIADHTIFTEEMLADMDEDMYEQIEEQLLEALVGGETNADHGDKDKEEYGNMTDDNTENDTVTENFVTKDELDERLNALEESITDTVEETLSERTNHEREQKARRVANAIDGMSVEAAEALPDDELDKLAEKHASRSNYAGVPGAVDRTPETQSAEEEFADYPAGGRTNYEQRSGGD